jgi:hypothetical protein
MRRMRLSLLASALLACAAFADDSQTDPSSTTPQAPPDATLDVSAGSVAVGIGVLWGHGNLTYDGAKHLFRISGVSLADVGAAHLDAKGDVYNLSKLDDFGGIYTTVAAGVTIAGGGSAAVLRNEHGVVIRLISKNSGLRLNLSAEKISLKLRT